MPNCGLLEMFMHLMRRRESFALKIADSAIPLQLSIPSTLRCCGVPVIFKKCLVDIAVPVKSRFLNLVKIVSGTLWYNVAVLDRSRSLHFLILRYHRPRPPKISSHQAKHRRYANKFLWAKVLENKFPKETINRRCHY